MKEAIVQRLTSSLISDDGRAGEDKPGANRRGRPSPQQSAAITERIIMQATAIFLRDGFDGTSMEAVAAAAGIPKTTLYKRFPDKKALVTAVLAEQIASWRSVTSRHDANLSDDLSERLRYYVFVMLRWGSTPEVRAFSRMAAQAYGHPETGLRRQNFFAYGEMLHLIAREIDTYAPKSGIHPRDPVKVATALMATLAGWLTEKDATPITEFDARRDAEFIVDLFLRGGAAW